MTEQSNQTMVAAVYEMKGQMHELIRTVDKLSEEVRGLSREVAQGMHLPEKIAENQASYTSLELRVSALENEQRERIGQMRLLKALPWTLLLAGVGAIAAIYRAWIG